MAKMGNLKNEVASLQRRLLQQRPREWQGEEEERGAQDKGERGPLEEKLLLLQQQLLQSVEERNEMRERLRVAHIERKNTIDENETLLSRFHTEKEQRRRAERLLRRQTYPDGVSIGSIRSACSGDVWRQEEIPIVMPVIDGDDGGGLGMELGSVVAVNEIAESGVAASHGVRAGDEVVEINHISLVGDKYPLEFAHRLFSSVAKTITLSVRRQVLSQQTSSGVLPLPEASPLEQQILSQHPPPNAGKAFTLPRDLHSPISSLELSLTPSRRQSPSRLMSYPVSFPTARSRSEYSIVSVSDGIEEEGKEEGEEERVIGETSVTGIGSFTSGIIQSPTETESFAHSFPLPDSITQCGTITSEKGFHLPDPLKEEKDEQEQKEEEEEEEKENLKEREEEGDRNSSNCSHTAEGQLPRYRVQAIHRKANAWRSRPLDDMRSEKVCDSEIVISPQLAPKNCRKKRRRVLLPDGQLGVGLWVVGGHGNGFFIWSEREYEHGLYTGDQIKSVGCAFQQVGSKSLEKTTYTELMGMFSSYATKGDQCLITVQQNMEGFLGLPSGSTESRDKFYVSPVHTAPSRELIRHIATSLTVQEPHNHMDSDDALPPPPLPRAGNRLASTYSPPPPVPIRTSTSILSIDQQEKIQTQMKEQVKLPPLTPSIMTNTSYVLPESHPDFIDPVETIHCDSSGGIYHNPLHGITLRIPEDAIPQGEHLEISIGMCLFGDFSFVNGLSPVSAIVWLCSKNHTAFLKPVEVIIPHFLECESKEDAESLEMQFMKANHWNSANKFVPADGKVDFTSVPYKGILHTYHFCYLCICAGVSPDQLKRCRFCIVCTIPRSITTASNVYFYVLYFLDTCIRSVEVHLDEGHFLHKPSTRVFRFSDMSLNVAAVTGQYECSAAQKPVTVTLQPTRISWDRIDFWQLHQNGELALMEKMELYPPCMLLTCGDLSSCEEQVVTVLFRGTQEPVEQMKIEIIVPSGKGTLIKTKTPPVQARPIPALKDMPTVRQLWLLKTEEMTPVRILKTLAPRWEELGTAVNFDPQGKHVQLIKKECGVEGPEACCKMVLKDWLCGKGDYQPPTWENMLKILEDMEEENLMITICKLLS